MKTIVHGILQNLKQVSEFHHDGAFCSLQSASLVPQCLIRDLESSYDLRLGAVVHDGAGVAEEFNSRQKMALGVVQRLLIDLGDLARYRFHYTIVPGGNSQFSLPYRFVEIKDIHGVLSTSFALV